MFSDPDYNHILDGSDGKVACDSYHKFKEDVTLIKDMNGINVYRFSLAWTRILPNGTGEINSAGLDYYNDLINELIANNIKPVVTMYHWDLPLALQDMGGWLNPESPKWFDYYADICYQAFGDRVKQWITINEPWVVAIAGHATGELAPGIMDSGIADYQVAHNLIKSHAKAYRNYHNKYASTQNGKSTAIK